MDKKIFKCTNCGSSEFKQVSEDFLQCVYCGAKLQNEKSLKSDFTKDIIQARAVRNIQYFKPAMTEDGFYKKAISHLMMSKNTPNDILDMSEFGFVDYRYEYFVKADVEFYLLKVDKKADDDKLSLSAKNKQFNGHHEQILVIALNEDLPSKELLDEVSILSDYEDDEYDFDLESLASKEVKQRPPKKEQIKGVLDRTLEDYKAKLLEKDQTGSNYVDHRVRSLKLYALPVYSLRYKYAHEDYEIISSACKFNITGTFPKAKEPLKNKGLSADAAINLTSIALSSVAGIFGIASLCTKLLSLLWVTLAFTGLAVVGFLFELCLSKIFERKRNENLFNIKLGRLKVFFERKGKIFSEYDEQYVQKELRWF